MTPGEAIRAFCIACVGGSIYETRNCGGDKCLNGGCDENGVCWLYPYRLGKGRPSVKLIRKTCLWCQGDQQTFVKECPTVSCPLHPYRMGHNPSRAGIGGIVGRNPR